MLQSGEIRKLTFGVGIVTLAAMNQMLTLQGTMNAARTANSNRVLVKNPFSITSEDGVTVRNSEPSNFGGCVDFVIF